MNGKTRSRAARVAYCGPIAQPGRPARGGYEAANRRLIDDLRLRGVEVLELPYPAPEGGTVSKSLAYALGFAQIAGALIRNWRRFAIFHFTPLYRQFLYGEAVLFLIASALGKPVVLDLRAGRFIQIYHERSVVYRWLMKTLLRHANLLAAEGEDYVAFASEWRTKPILYLPNYVRAETAKPAAARALAGGPVRLLYLGRVVPEKGVEIAIGALRSLRAMGLDAELEILGKSEDAYVARLKHEARGLPVVWHGPVSADAVRSLLAGAHFFIFPTRHTGEGHSNALTEAMAEGLVPVCSDNGFNRSVVGNAGRVLPLAADASDYARAIKEIGTGDEWRQLSQQARGRVFQLYTADAVVPTLIECYRAAARLSQPRPGERGRTACSQAKS
jgi:glycosyltransferase involved in cell wall biosynthesis